MSDEFNWPVTVTLCDVEQHGSSAGWMPENLAEAVKWLSGYLGQVPPEYRDSAEIDIGSGVEYDVEYATITISYRRPPTNEEIAQRIVDDKARKAAQMERAREQYERLKDVFEKS